MKYLEHITAATQCHTVAYLHFSRNNSIQEVPGFTGSDVFASTKGPYSEGRQKKLKYLRSHIEIQKLKYLRCCYTFRKVISYALYFHLRISNLTYFVKDVVPSKLILNKVNALELQNQNRVGFWT